MQVTLKQKRYKIPKTLFSEAYNGLSFKQQRAVLRTLHKTHKTLYIKAFNLGGEMESIGKEIVSFRETRRLPKGQEDYRAYVQQLGQGLNQLLENKKALTSQLKEFVNGAKQHFNEFNPLEVRSTPKSGNYIERMVYEAAQEIRYLTDVYYRAQNNLRPLLKEIK